MRILLVKLKNIGDSLLLTPTAVGVKSNYPDSEIHVVVRRGCEGILSGCGAIDFIHTSAKPGAKKMVFVELFRDLILIKKLRKLRFDYAFELGHGDRGRFIVGMSGARNRCVNVYARPLNKFWRNFFNKQATINWSNFHQVEMDYQTVNYFLNLPEDIPSLCFEKERAVCWDKGSVLIDFVVLHPTARWKRKMLQVEKWVDVCRWLLTRVQNIVLSTGPESDEIQYGIKLKERFGNRILMTNGKTTWGQLAWLLYRARLFVGVDTAAMHLAAACGCPIVAVFGPTSTREWRPWKVEHELVLPDKEAFNIYPPESVINSITSSEIIKACERILA